MNESLKDLFFLYNFQWHCLLILKNPIIDFRTFKDEIKF